MNITKRATLHGLTALALAGVWTGAHAQTAAAYPTKPIRLIIPLAAGSAVDNAARILLQKMSANLGQAIVIENQPGAAGLIGAQRRFRRCLAAAQAARASAPPSVPTTAPTTDGICRWWARKIVAAKAPQPAAPHSQPSVVASPANTSRAKIGNSTA